MQVEIVAFVLFISFGHGPAGTYPTTFETLEQCETAITHLSNWRLGRVGLVKDDLHLECLPQYIVYPLEELQ